MNELQSKVILVFSLGILGITLYAIASSEIAEQIKKSRYTREWWARKYLRRVLAAKKERAREKK